MRLGKIPEAVRKRSVLKELTNKCFEADKPVTCISSAPASIGELGYLLPHAAANQLTAAGAKPTGILMDVVLSEDTEESRLKKLMRDADGVCEQMGMQVFGVHAQAFRTVQEPFVSVTGIGTKEERMFGNEMFSGMDIVISKWIGLYGTAFLADRKKEILNNRLPAHLLVAAKDFSRYISVVPEAQIALAHRVSAMHVVSEGGIFGALWEMAERSKVGLTIELRRIPLRQETVEICECLQLNPYLLHSEGALLMAAENGQALVHALQEADIEATVIGKATEGNDRVLINEEERRFLDLPAMDELYKAV